MIQALYLRYHKVWTDYRDICLLHYHRAHFKNSMKSMQTWIVLAQYQVSAEKVFTLTHQLLLLFLIWTSLWRAVSLLATVSCLAATDRRNLMLALPRHPADKHKERVQVKVTFFQSAGLGSVAAELTVRQSEPEGQISSSNCSQHAGSLLDSRPQMVQ